MHARRWDQESRNLFRAGIALLEVIAEVDNREARSFEMLMTVGPSSGGSLCGEADMFDSDDFPWHVRRYGH